MPSDRPAPRLAIFASFSGQGGVERMLVNLLAGFAARGVAVELLLARADGPFVAAVPDSVCVIRLRAGHTATSIPELARYLARARPPALLAVKDRAIRAAVRARWLARVPTRIVGRLGTNLTAALAHKSRTAAALRRAPMRRVYRRVERIVAVSEGVASDTRALTGLSGERVVVVRNPVVTPAFFEQAQAPAPHPWLDEPRLPVVVAAGRLTRQKGFDTLIGAFAQLRAALACRLLIAGDGPQRAALARLIDAYGLAECAVLLGFVARPAALLARGDLFVLSSRWEGSPNALTEALALGRPVVATDCPSGPREILADGAYGPLVAVDDVAQLACAMQATLAAPLPAATLRQAARDYTVAASVAGYLEALELA